MQTLKTRIKNTLHPLSQWVITDKLRKLYLTYRSPKTQKFWLGGPELLEAPSFEKAFFSQNGLFGRVIKRQDDYRASAKVNKELTFTIKKEANSSGFQFAVSSINKEVQDRKFKISINNESRAVYGLNDQEWCDLRFDFNDNEECIVNISSNHLFELTCPRQVVKGDSKSPKHVITIIMDAWSSEYLNGSHPITGEASFTPNIDKFFAKGFKAKSGYSSAGWTLPTVGTLFTGLYTSGHKMFSPSRWTEFNKESKTIPELFQENGYHTALGSCVTRITPAFGHNRGIDRFLYHFPERSDVKYDNRVWVDEIIAHIEAHQDSKTFSYFQFPDPHPSWDQPPQTRLLNLSRRGNTTFDFNKVAKVSYSDIDKDEQTEQIYKLRIYDLDRLLGNLFRYLESTFQDDEYFVIVTADHGIRMPHLNEDRKMDEPFLTKVRVNIPLFARGINVPDTNYEGIISPNLDVPETLKNILKGDEKPFGKGIDFRSLDKLKDRNTVLSESIYNGLYELSVRRDGYVYYEKFKMNEIAMKFETPTALWSHFEFEDTNGHFSKQTLENEESIKNELYNRAQKHYEEHNLLL